MAKCAGGEACILGDGKRPTAATTANRIRAGLIRFLLLGGDDAHPVHENGVKLKGAWITDTLTVENVKAAVGLYLVKCWFAESISARDATCTGLSLRGSQLPGLSADRVVVTGSVFLDGDFTATGEVRLLGAQIGCDLTCTGGTFGNADKDGKPLGDALSADGMKVTGGVFLDGDFTATGEVRLRGAQIGVDLYCDGGTFRSKLQGVALNADGMTVTGGLFMRAAKLFGPVSLTTANIGSLVDDRNCWPDGSLLLNGFRYGRIADGPTDASTRIAWLKKQYPPHLGDEFKPQPWEQLIKVLREMGHPGEAAEVAIAKQRALRKAGKIGQRRPDPRYSGWCLGLDKVWVAGANLLARGWHRIYGWLAGFGYRPAGILMWMVIVAALSGWYFSTAADAGIMAPSSAEVFAHKQIHADLHARGNDAASCGIQREVPPTRYWPACTALPSEYTTFNPWLYSLDMILPLVDLQQDTHWSPSATYTDAKQVAHTLPGGVIARVIMWFEILFGWFASLMFVAIAGRLVEKD